jgi:hypothetical protein
MARQCGACTVAGMDAGSAYPPRGRKLVRLLLSRSAGSELKVAGIFQNDPSGPYVVATCRCDQRHGQVPPAEGMCGFHLDAEPHGSWRRLSAPFAIRADVELYGRVLEHGDDEQVEGWRGQKQRVLGVDVPRACTGCEARDLPAEQLGLCVVNVPIADRWVGLHPYCLPCVSTRKLTKVPLADVAGMLGVGARWEPTELVAADLARTGRLDIS